MKQHPPQIALLGTSADPPTYGHQALLEGLLKLFPTVVTWASNNPIKCHSASLENRQRLLQGLVKAIAHPKLHLVQELSSPWTITTLERAQSRWPNSKLTFVVGSDLVSQIPKWVRAKDVLEKARLGIAPRGGWPLKQNQIKVLESLGGSIDLLPLKIPATASSKIRSKARLGQIPNCILPIVLKENLYGLTSNP